jgi:hypothetical protein
MRSIFLIIMLLSVGTLYAVSADDTAASYPDDGYSARITISLEPLFGLELYDEDITRIEQDISTVFLNALQQTARFSNVVIDSAERSISDFDSDTLIVNLMLSRVLIETDPESGRKKIQAEAEAESYYSNQKKDERTRVEFKILGIGETFDESLQSAVDGLTYSVMSIVRMFPLPGAGLAIYDLYNNYPLVLFENEPVPSIGTAYNLVSGMGEILGLAEISRLVPLAESEGSAAELQIIYSDISIVPGVGIQPLESNLVQIKSAVSLSYGVVGADIVLSGTSGQGFVPSAGVGVVWVWDDPYPTGSFFIQQANTVLPMVSCGFIYRVIPGKKLVKTRNLFFGRARIDLEAFLMGGYLFNLLSSTGNGLVYGNRFTAGISWYITESVEISTKCRYDRIYKLNGSSNPILSTIFGSVGVTFRL